MSYRPFFQAILATLRYAVLPVIVIVSVVSLGMFFFFHGRAIMVEDLKNRLQDTAALAAVQFNASTIEEVRTFEDMKKDAYNRLVTRLYNTRETLPNIRFAYILRQTSDPNTLEFVADADGLLSPDQLDLNKNGVVDSDEEPGHPGDPYDITNAPALHNVTRPTVDPTFTTDQWGTFISGYAPILDANGKVIAILGVDMNAADFNRLSQRVFSPVALLLIAVAGVMMIAYVLLVVRQRRIESMQQLNAERTALMDLATHQLGAPLATFKWWIEILQEHRAKHRHTEEEKKEDDDAFNQLQEGITRMDDIIGSLRTAVHMQSTQVNYAAANVGLLSIINAIPTSTSVLLKRRKQKLVLNIPAGLKITVDRKLFTGVMQEFIENASWYSREKSTITIRAKKHLNHVTIEVEDTGYGILPEDLPHIFEQFKRGTNATSYKPVGNGLGLFIAKGIIEGAKGDISVQSIVNKGTIFTITLPAA